MAKYTMILGLLFSASLVVSHDDGPGCKPPHTTHRPTTISTITTSSSVDTHCPTITSTKTLCSTCTILDCLYLSTISRPCDCASPVPTVYADYGCGASKCPTGCGTTYIYATSTSTCSTPSSTSSLPPSSSKTSSSSSITSAPIPSSCTFRPTQTLYSSKGCKIPCDTTQFCISDAAVTVSCGCTTAPVVPTTITTCATATNCIQCTTGWGLFTYTETNCPKPTAW